MKQTEVLFSIQKKELIKSMMLSTDDANVVTRKNIIKWLHKTFNLKMKNVTIKEEQPGIYFIYYTADITKDIVKYCKEK